MSDTLSVDSFKWLSVSICPYAKLACAGKFNSLNMEWAMDKNDKTDQKILKLIEKRDEEIKAYKKLLKNLLNNPIPKNNQSNKNQAKKKG